METKPNKAIEVEIKVNEKPPVPKEALSDETVDKLVQQLRRGIINRNYHLDGDDFKLAQQLATNSKEYLDNETYFWVMYAYALHYASVNNPNAEIYCMVRLRNLLEANDNKVHQPKALTFKPMQIEDEVKKTIYKRSDFVNEIVKESRNKFLILEGVLGIIVAILLVTLFKVSLPIAVLVVILVTTISYFVNFASIKKTFLSNQVNESRSYCQDQELLDFDLPVMNS